jgi:hypothetical protein
MPVLAEVPVGMRSFTVTVGDEQASIDVGMLLKNTVPSGSVR